MKKYQIRVADQEYHVEIADLAARPVRVNVEGEWFEVWPEEHPPSPRPADAQPAQESPSRPVPGGITPGNGTPPEPDRKTANAIKAPLPGVVTAIHINLGDEVTVGQPVCVLEAMKMNNVVRASSNGIVVAVRVTIGQHVKHHDVLVELV